MKSSEIGYAFRDGRIAAGGNVQTDGTVVYSYQMLIARRTGNGVEVIDRKHSPSVTTSKHIGYVLRACPNARVVDSLDDKPGR